MTKKSGDERASCLNEESFQEKQNEITIVSRETMPRNPLLFFPCAGTDEQIPPHERATTPNARLKRRRKATELVPCMG